MFSSFTRYRESPVSDFQNRFTDFDGVLMLHTTNTRTNRQQKNTFNTTIIYVNPQLLFADS